MRKQAKGGRADDGALALRLFDQLFPSPSWRAWRVFIQAAFGLAISPADLQVFRACTGRTRAPVSIASRIAAICGRRSGKSRLAAFIIYYLAAFKNYDDVLSPGEVAVVMVMNASRAQAHVVFRYVLAFLESMPSTAAMIVRRTADTIELSNRVVIQIQSASYRLPRGFTCVAFVGDESSFWSTETGSANPDVEILRAILPSLLTTGGPVVLISTPYARSGVIYEDFDKHFGVDDDPTLVWMADTLTMNPTVDAAVIDKLYADDPEVAASEYGRAGHIAFRSDLQSLFLRDALQKCVREGPRELPPHLGACTGFVDTASGSDESYTLAISHRDPHGRAIVDCVREWPSPFDPFVVTAEAATVLRRYQCATVSGDRYSPGWVAGAFKQHSIDYVVSERTKSQIFMEMAALVNAGSVELPDDPRLLAQFLGLQRRCGSSGRDSVDHRSGQRDDLANAVSGAAVMAASGTGRVSLDAIFHGCAKNSGLPEPSRVHCVLHGGGYQPSDPICRKECAGWAVVRPAWVAYQQTGGPEPLRLFVQRRFTSPSMERSLWADFIRQAEGVYGV